MPFFVSLPDPRGKSLCNFSDPLVPKGRGRKEHFETVESGDTGGGSASGFTRRFPLGKQRPSVQPPARTGRLRASIQQFGWKARVGGVADRVLGVAGRENVCSTCMGDDLVHRLGEEVGRGLALAEHHVVLQQAEIVDRRIDVLLPRPIGRRTA